MHSGLCQCYRSYVCRMRAHCISLAAAARSTRPRSWRLRTSAMGGCRPQQRKPASQPARARGAPRAPRAARTSPCATWPAAGVGRQPQAAAARGTRGGTATRAVRRILASETTGRLPSPSIQWCVTAALVSIRVRPRGNRQPARRRALRRRRRSSGHDARVVAARGRAARRGLRGRPLGRPCWQDQARDRGHDGEPQLRPPARAPRAHRPAHRRRAEAHLQPRQWHGARVRGLRRGRRRARGPAPRLRLHHAAGLRLRQRERPGHDGRLRADRTGGAVRLRDVRCERHYRAGAVLAGARVRGVRPLALQLPVPHQPQPVRRAAAADAGAGSGAGCRS